MAQQRHEHIFWAKTAFSMVGWALICTALMQPLSKGEYPEELRLLSKQKVTSGLQLKPQDVYLLMDASTSMSIKDMSGNTSRFEFAKQVVDQVVSQLSGERVALDAFTTELIPLSPLTNDYLFVRLMLKQLDLNEKEHAGTDFQVALSKFLSDNSDAIKTLVFLSDGGDTQLEYSSGEEYQKRLTDILEPIKEAKKLKVLTIGVGALKESQIPGLEYEGKPVYTKLDESILQKMAQQGHGRYFRAIDHSLIDLSSAIVSDIEKEKEFVQSDRGDLLIKTLYFQIPLGWGILLFALVLVLPDTFAKRVVNTFSALLLMMNFTLPASEKEDMPEAAAYYDVGEYRNARELYEQKAQETDLQPWERAILLYNIGTAYLSEGNWKEAIDTLKAVPLEDNPSPLLRERRDRNLAIAEALKNQSRESLTNTTTLKTTEKEKAIQSLLEMYQEDYLPAVEIKPSKSDQRPW